MKMWTQGLGKIELEVDFSRYKVVEEEKEAVIKGITDAPVHWEFTVRVGKEDIAGVINIFFKPSTLIFVIKNIRYIIQFFIEKLLTNRKKYEEVTLDIEKA